MFQRIHVDADRLVGDLVGFRRRRLRRRDCRSSSRPASSSRRGGCRLRRRRGAAAGAGAAHFGRGLAEGALQFVERDFAGTQRALQNLRHQRALLSLRADGRRGNGRRRSFGRSSAAACCRARPSLQLDDQIFVGAFGLGLGGFQAGEDFLDAVDLDRISDTASPSPACRRGICPSGSRRHAPALPAAAARGSRRCP